jgi:hypothetical protein
MPLLVEQPVSPRAGAWLAADPAIALWTLTPVEIASALRRLVREGAVEDAAARAAEARVDDLRRAAHLVVDVEAARQLGSRLLRLHPLRAADALQLAAALLWAEGRPQGRVLHTLDGRLAQAAEREGFLVPG